MPMYDVEVTVLREVRADDPEEAKRIALGLVLPMPHADQAVCPTDPDVHAEAHLLDEPGYARQALLRREMSALTEDWGLYAVGADGETRARYWASSEADAIAQYRAEAPDPLPAVEAWELDTDTEGTVLQTAHAEPETPHGPPMVPPTVLAASIDDAVSRLMQTNVTTVEVEQRNGAGQVVAIESRPNVEVIDVFEARVLDTPDLGLVDRTCNADGLDGDHCVLPNGHVDDHLDDREEPERTSTWAGEDRCEVPYRDLGPTCQLVAGHDGPHLCHDPYRSRRTIWD